MRRVSTIVTTIAMTMAMTFSMAAQVRDTRDRTIMTFSKAVELPNMRLEAGTYVFRLADTAGRNVIQVMPADESKVLGQWLFIPADRQEATSDTVVTFRETSATATPAVQYWYYPGEKTGKEFIYPKDQAMKIAARTGVTVQSEDGPVTAQGVVQAGGQQASAQTDGVAAAVQTQRTEPVASDRTVSETQVAARDTSRVRQESTIAQNTQNNDPSVQNELPATASRLPLSGLISLIVLAGAAGIRAFRS